MTEISTQERRAALRRPFPSLSRLEAASGLPFIVASVSALADPRAPIDPAEGSSG
ncbi:MAG: hypothetical protein MJB57_16780 [Gemmatimonadetes bacterium]|nr:hypothetical protein [Gemmatimonadota bacterium]